VRPASRPRRLCWRCHSAPDVRARYAPVGVRGEYGTRNLAADGGGALPPDAPTAAWAGSAEKLAALAERAARRQALWHPDDARHRLDVLTAARLRPLASRLPCPGRPRRPPGLRPAPRRA
jgi:hypothetical protein